MPFITEEIWQKLPGTGGTIMTASFPEYEPAKQDKDAEDQMKLIRDVISSARNIRGEMNIKPGVQVKLYVKTRDKEKEHSLNKEASKTLIRELTKASHYVIGRDTHGGAIYIDNANSVSDMQDTIIFKKTKFIKNYAKANNSVYGGAVYARVNTYFENCLFLDNGIDGSNNSNNSIRNH